MKTTTPRIYIPLSSPISSGPVGSPFLWLPPSQQHKYTFPASIFLNDSFSANDFVQEFRSRVDNLDTLKQELAQFHHFLREETVSIIHRDYNSFIEFSGQLESIKDQVEQVKSNLPQVRESIQQFSALVDNVVTQCMVQQNRVKNAQKKREKAMYLLNIRTQLELLEANNITDQSLHDGRTLEDIAKQLQHVRLQLDSRTDLLLQDSNNEHKSILERFYSQCEEQWTNIDSKTQQVLQTLLLETKSEELLTNCLEALSICNKQRDVELLLEAKLMQPIMESINLQRMETISDPQNMIYGPLLERIHERFHLLLRITMREDNYTRLGFEFLTRTILPILCHHLQECKHLYEYRDVTKFHSQYLAQHDFFLELEQRYITCYPQLEQFRQAECLQTLFRKWNLKIYFMLIKQKIAVSFEQICTAKQQQQKHASNKITFPVLQQCWNILHNQMFSSNVFLYRLMHDSLNLYVQILSRLQRWAKEFITNSDIDSSACLLAQLHLLRDLINRDMLSHIRHQYSPHVLESCNEIIHETSNRLLLDEKTILYPIADKIIKHYALQCSKSFEKMASITRNLHGSVAENPSQYVAQILPKLTQFAEDYAHLPETAKWTEQVILIICDKYLVACKDLLTSSRRTEISLQKLQKHSSGKTSQMAGSSSSMTLSQIKLDVAEFARIIQQNFPHVMTALENSQAFKELDNLQLEE
jgi:hypothetical protein